MKNRYQITVDTNVVYDYVVVVYAFSLTKTSNTSVEADGVAIEFEKEIASIVEFSYAQGRVK